MPSPPPAFDPKRAAHAHSSPSGPPKREATPLSPTARAAVFATKSLAAADDPERHLFAHCGPHEAWTEGPEQERAQAQAKLERLGAADAAAAELDGEVTNAPTECTSRATTRAIEVELRDAAGPLRGVTVALDRAAPAGVLTGKSNAQGLVRFEGLLASDQHRVWLPALARDAWTVTTTAALPSERATTGPAAKWPASGSTAAATAEVQHEVAPGECTWTLAHAHGLDQDTLWSANPALAEAGRRPNALAPGDLVVLPAKGEPEREDAKPGTRITIEVEAVLPRARLCFQDPDGKARAGLVFVARVVTKDGTEHVWEGKTDGNGGFDESVPADARTLDVVLEVEPEPQPYRFRFGYLDPLATISGVQGRLVNLGYDCGEERGELGPLTLRSLRDFQLEHELPSTRELDDATRAELEKLYER